MSVTNRRTDGPRGVGAGDASKKRRLESLFLSVVSLPFYEVKIKIRFGKSQTCLKYTNECSVG